MLHYCHTTNVYQIPCTSHLRNHSMGIYDVCTFKPNQTILIVVQKIPGNPMSDEENIGYLKQIKKQELHFKSI